MVLVRLDFGYDADYHIKEALMKIPDYSVAVFVRDIEFHCSPLLPGFRSARIIEGFLDVLDADLGGDVAEFGIAGGHTLRALATHLDNIESKKLAWGFDCFEGLPALTAEDGPAPPHNKGAILSTSCIGWYKGTVDQVEAHLGALENYRLVDGLIQDTGPIFAHKLCFAHINTDLYAGCWASLLVCGREMVKGGKIVVSGYRTHWQGMSRAVDKFLNENPYWHTDAEEWCVTLTRKK